MKQTPISDLQNRIYAFVVEYIKAEGMPPTNREIGHAMEVSSTGHIDYHLTQLEKKGLISRESKKSRGIKLIKRPTGIPIIGTIAAGVPLDIFPNTPELLPVDRTLQGQTVFALIVRGRSMIDDHICNGDYVVILPQSTCHNGDIVVATHLQSSVSGSATLKRFFQERNQIRLQPANSVMEPLFIPKSEWDREWKVQGKVITIFRQFRAAT